MPNVRILLLSIAAAVFYGIVHDQITAHLCVEYFTIAHERRIESTSPTVLGFYFGFAATAWVGVLLGLPLALSCQLGAQPRLSAGDLVQPLGCLLLFMGGCALAAGATGYLLHSRGSIANDGWEEAIPTVQLSRFFAVRYAHLASYGSGFLGGVALSVWAARRRHRLATLGRSS